MLIIEAVRIWRLRESRAVPFFRRTVVVLVLPARIIFLYLGVLSWLPVARVYSRNGHSHLDMHE